MNRFVPMATTSFQPVGYYVPQPLTITRTNTGMFGATEFGAAKKKGKKKGKKKENALTKTLKTAGKAGGALLKEAGADLLKKKTGIDITGETPADTTAVDTGTSDAGYSSESGSGSEEPKKSNMPLIIGGVVAALALAGGGFYLYKKKKSAAASAAV